MDRNGQVAVPRSALIPRRPCVHRALVLAAVRVATRRFFFVFIALHRSAEHSFITLSTNCDKIPTLIPSRLRPKMYVSGTILQELNAQPPHFYRRARNVSRPFSPPPLCLPMPFQPFRIYGSTLLPMDEGL